MLTIVDNLSMNNIIGERIKSQREKLGLIQADLAEKANVSRASVVNWETGKRIPSIEDVKSLARVLDTSLMYIMGETNDPQRYPGTLLGGNESGNPPFPLYLRRKNIDTSTQNTNSTPAFSNAKEMHSVVWIPVVSDKISICAGNGNSYPDIEWETVDYFPFSEQDILGYGWQGASFRVISVEGNSMEPIILDGDKVLFASDVEIETGDIAVVSWAGRLLIRGVILNRDKTITLHPANSEYSDIHIDPQEQDLYVIGKVLKAVNARKIGKMW